MTYAQATQPTRPVAEATLKRIGGKSSGSSYGGRSADEFRFFLHIIKTNTRFKNLKYMSYSKYVVLSIFKIL